MSVLRQPHVQVSLKQTVVAISDSSTHRWNANPLSPRWRKAARRSSLLRLNDRAPLGAEGRGSSWCAEPVLPPDHGSHFHLRPRVLAPISALALINNLACSVLKQWVIGLQILWKQMSQFLGTADKDSRSTTMFISVTASKQVKFEIATRWNTRQVEGARGGRMRFVF